MQGLVLQLPLPSALPSAPGVPLSTQWGPQGYFYPIQIAQYGLSHYSKNLTEKAPHIEVYETAEERDQGGRSGDWTVPKGCSVTTLPDKSRFTNVKQFVAPGESLPMARRMPACLG